MNAYQNMKNSGVAWLDEIPSELEQKQARYIFKQAKDNVGDDPSRYELLSLTLRGIIPRSQVDGGKNPENYDTYQVVHEDDLIMCLFDYDVTPRTVGRATKTGMVTGAYTNLRPLKGVSTRYYNYFFLALDTTKELLHLCTGLRNGISKPTFFSLNLPVPSYGTQEKIADYLDNETVKIDTLISKQEHLLELLEEKRRSAITLAVTNDGWPKEKIKYIASRRDQKVEAVNALSYIGLEHVESFTGRQIKAVAQSEPDGLTLGYQKHDVLFGKLRPYLAKVLLATDDGICSSEFIVLKASNKFLPEFLKYSILNEQFIELINSSTYGAKMPRANWDFIGNSMVAVPSIDEQNTIIAGIKKHDDKTRKLKAEILKQIKLLKERRVSLISNVVTGKVKV